MNLFCAALQGKNTARPPVWMMRQAGRYHKHYQALRRAHSFIELCKNPYLACEVALGPVMDFDFDAAILFSDLLFPLEALGMPLRYDPGPILDWHIEQVSDIDKLECKDPSDFLGFQGLALELTRKALPAHKGLLGFVGGPLTLFCYAVQGGHKGSLAKSLSLIEAGLFDRFCEKLEPVLVRNIELQSTADCVAMMDTCAGSLTPDVLKKYIMPWTQRILAQVKVPMLYYSLGTTSAHLATIPRQNVVGIGVDWNNSLPDLLMQWPVVQGNINPEALFMDQKALRAHLTESWQALSGVSLAGWICGLGHGVLPGTPEENVRFFVQYQREVFHALRKI